LDALGLEGNIGDLGSNLLHSSGHFVGGDASLDFGISNGIEVSLIEFVNGADHGSPVPFFDAFGI